MFLDDLYIQKRIRGGDIKEFERLFARYYKPLCLSAEKIVKDMDAAEDIVQEFFYKFWKNRESLNLKISLNAYFYHSIRMNSLHHIQHKAVMEKYSEDIRSEVKHQAPAEETDQLGYSELRRAIEATLEKLPERCSRVFRLNRFEGKKYEEIAGLLSVSVKTVEADMGKALRLFRESLKEFTTTT